MSRNPSASGSRTAGHKKTTAAAAGLSSLTKGLSAAAGTRPDYGIGDRVRHIKFGDGTVTELKEGARDYEVTVDFDEGGTRRMFAAFAKLKKL